MSDEIADPTFVRWLISKTPYCEVCTRLAEGAHVVLADGRGLFVLCEECFAAGEPYKSARSLKRMSEEPIRESDTGKQSKRFLWARVDTGKGLL
jgi:ribosome-binding protein aMBF1 (putative translation factor)